MYLRYYYKYFFICWFFYLIIDKEPRYKVNYYVNQTEEVTYSKSYNKKFKFKPIEINNEEYESSKYHTCWFTTSNWLGVEILSETKYYNYSIKAYLFYGDEKEIFMYYSQLNSSLKSFAEWSNEYKENDLVIKAWEYNIPTYKKSENDKYLFLSFLYEVEDSDYFDLSIKISHLNYDIKVLELNLRNGPRYIDLYGIYNGEIMLIENEINFNDILAIKILLNDFFNNIEYYLTNFFGLKLY